MPHIYIGQLDKAVELHPSGQLLTFWQPFFPADLIDWRDMRGVARTDVSALAEGYNLFVYNRQLNAAELTMSGYFYVGDDPDALATGRIKTEFQKLANTQNPIVGSTVAECFYNIHLTHSDPRIHNEGPPSLRPYSTRDQGAMKLSFPGFRATHEYRSTVENQLHPHWTRLLERLCNIYEQSYDRATGRGGRVGSQPGRWLMLWCQLFGVNPDPQGTDWEVFISRQALKLDPNTGERVVPSVRTTVRGDDFREDVSNTPLESHQATGANGGWNWLEGSPSADVIAASDVARNTSGDQQASYINDTDGSLSDDGHKIEVDVDTSDASNRVQAVLEARHNGVLTAGNVDSYTLEANSASDDMGFKRKDNGNALAIGSTSLTTGAMTEDPPFRVKLHTDLAGNWEAFIDTTSKFTHTDDNHAGNVDFGLMWWWSFSSNLSFDNLTAEDDAGAAASFVPIFINNRKRYHHMLVR